MLLTSLTKNFGTLQHSILSMSSLPGYGVDMVIRCMEEEDTLICRRVEQGLPANPNTAVDSPPAFATTRPNRPRPFCENYNLKKEGHHTDFCIFLVGKWKVGHLGMLCELTETTSRKLDPLETAGKGVSTLLCSFPFCSDRPVEAYIFLFLLVPFLCLAAITCKAPIMP